MANLLLLEKPESPSDLASHELTRRFIVLPFAFTDPAVLYPNPSAVVTTFDSFPPDQLNLLLGIDNLLRKSIDVLTVIRGHARVVSEFLNPA
jgi:hypothetical protein